MKIPIEIAEADILNPTTETLDKVTDQFKNQINPYLEWTKSCVLCQRGSEIGSTVSSIRFQALRTVKSPLGDLREVEYQFPLSNCPVCGRDLTKMVVK